MKSIFPRQANHLRFALLGYALFVLSGCATMKDCNPRHDPGFIGSINCHGSGAYGQRQEVLKQSVTQAQAEQNAMEAELRGTEDKSQELTQQIEQAQQELDGMDRQAQALQSSLSKTQNNNNALVSKVNSLQRKIKTLKAETRKTPPNRVEIEQLQKQLNQAQKEHDAYLGK